MARLLGVLLAALPLAPPGAAQQAPVAVEEAQGLAWLVGRWQGQGTMFGNSSEATLEVRPASVGAALDLDYRAGAFAGRAAYRPLGGGRWRADWTDNRGAALAIEAVAAERTLTAEWSGAERGRTVYRLAEDGRLHVTDSVARPDGGFRDFASHVLTRAD